MKNRLVFFVYVDKEYKDSVIYDIHISNLIWQFLKVSELVHLDLYHSLQKRSTAILFFRPVYVLSAYRRLPNSVL